MLFRTVLGLSLALSLAGVAFAQELIKAPLESGTPVFFTESEELVSTSAFLGAIQPTLIYKISRSDRLPSRDGRQLGTTHQQLMPELQFAFLAQWDLRYTPVFSWYSNPAFSDHVDQRIDLRGAFRVAEEQFRLSQSFRQTTRSLIETGRQTREQTWNTALSWERSIGVASSLAATLGQRFRSTEALTDAGTWSGMGWFRHRISPTFKVGMGAGGGYTRIDRGFDLHFQQAKGTFLWNPGARLSMNVEAGIDVRQSTESDSKVNPLWSATVSYSPVGSTIFAVTAEQATDASYFTNQISKSNLLRISLRQRLLGVLFLNVNGRWARNDYLAVGLAVRAPDETQGFGVSLSTRLLQRLDLSVSYQESENSSPAIGQGINSSSVGAEARWTF